jgi:hypothetical protein
MSNLHSSQTLGCRGTGTPKDKEESIDEKFASVMSESVI